MGSEFDDVYSRKGMYYGSNPSLFLYTYLPKRTRVHSFALDIGCGDGRNSIFLAKNGFEVDAIDNSTKAIEKLQHISINDNLSIHPIQADITQYEFHKKKYSLIVANTILDHLEIKAGNELITHLKMALNKDGMIFASVFTVLDPGNQDLPAKSATAKFIKRYFLPGELKELFFDLTILLYHEEEFLDIKHGKPHYHNIARIIAKCTD